MSDGWDGLLDPDERIIWQGAPVVRVRMEWDNPMHPFFFLFFTGFSLFWMFMAAQGGGFFWAFGLLFFAVGIYNLVLIHFWRAYQRRNTHYTLTNKRAFIATQGDFRGKRLESYPLNEDTPVSFVDGALSSIHFATRLVTTNKTPREKPIGFEDLRDGREVYALIRKVQERAA